MQNPNRKQSKYDKCTVGDIRNQLKDEFKKRLHIRRNSQVDRFRGRPDETVGDRELETLKAAYTTIITGIPPEADVVDTDAILNLLNNIKEEIVQEEFQMQAEIHKEELERELNDLIRSSFPACLICCKVVEAHTHTNVICEECGQNYFS